MSIFNSKRSNIAPFLAIDMLTKANNLESKGRNIIHMDVGEPGVRTPKHILDFGKKIIQEKHIGYTESIGVNELRYKISEHYKNWYEQDVNYESVAVTAGASGAFVLALLSLFDPGDKVVMMTPYYPAYINVLKVLNLEIIYIDGEHEFGYQPTLEKLKKIKSNIKGIIIASPANPTGSILKNIELKNIANWCKINNKIIICDEIYHGIEYGRKSDTILKYNKDAIVINSFSKYFCMTGWRLGWLIAPNNIIKNIEKLSMSLFLCPSTIAQNIATKAFDDYDILNKNVTLYKKNRDLMINFFEDIGFSKYAPVDGAFYLYLDISRITDDSGKLARNLLNDAGVSVTPGEDFDHKLGKKYIRISYGGSTQDIIEAIKRIDNWLNTKI
jgi:aspartate/methionine/tyrosine aminotransferase